MAIGIHFIDQSEGVLGSSCRALWITGGLVMALALSACAGTREVGGAPGLMVLPDQELPPPMTQDYARNAEQHLLAPFDKVIIDVRALEGLQARQVQIDASGRFALPWIGPVHAAGLSISELESLLVQRLRESHMRKPEVVVNLGEAASRRVTIEGQVKNPGLYPIQGRATLLQGMALAGGTTEFANSRLVIIFRNVGDQKMAAIYDINRIRLGMDRDPEIYPNDIIMIDDNKAKRLFGEILQTVIPLTILISTFR